MFGHFSGKRGGVGLPDSKDFQELIPALAWTFSNKMGEDDQNPNTLSNKSPYEIGVRKSSSKASKNTGGGQGPLDKIQTETYLFVGWLPLENLGGLQLNWTPCISENVIFLVWSAACCEMQIPF